MDGSRAALLAELARITARVSVVVFAAALAAGTAELARPRAAFSQRGAGWKLLAALLVSHTIHFAIVAALTVETHGRNVEGRGGWVLTSVVGVLFYAFTTGALALRRSPPDARGVARLVADGVLCGLVGLAFLLIYVGRMGESLLFAALGSLVAVTLIAFELAVVVRLVRRTRTAAGSGNA